MLICFQYHKHIICKQLLSIPFLWDPSFFSAWSRSSWQLCCQATCLLMYLQFVLQYMVQLVLKLGNDCFHCISDTVFLCWKPPRCIVVVSLCLGNQSDLCHLTIIQFCCNAPLLFLFNTYYFIYHFSVNGFNLPFKELQLLMRCLR